MVMTDLETKVHFDGLDMWSLHHDGYQTKITVVLSMESSSFKNKASFFSQNPSQ